MIDHSNRCCPSNHSTLAIADHNYCPTLAADKTVTGRCQFIRRDFYFHQLAIDWREKSESTSSCECANVSAAEVKKKYLRRMT
ncbi:unnamed protein product, partial [Nesidiocoris tenuis]